PVQVDSRGEGVGHQRDRTPAARPCVGGQGHWDVADRRGSLSLQVDRCAKRLEASLRTVTAARASLRLWEAQSGWNAGPASSAAWLQDRVLLRPERGARDVLRGFQGKPKLLSAAKEDLLLAPHRRRRDRQRLLHPLVVRQQIAIAEREEMSTIVGVPV